MANEPPDPHSCPACNCRDLRETKPPLELVSTDARGNEVIKRRVYRVCRHCGRRVSWIEPEVASRHDH